MTDDHNWLESINWNEDGLVPAITIDSDTGKVLTLAWMNREALETSAASGRATYWSRSRRKLWVKGETSGHTQTIVEIRADCDKDAILLMVQQSGGIACHTGRYSCFYFKLKDNSWETAEPVIKDPNLIYKSET
jgi:phosphoribosyl-AMP cyclohydrolase